MARLSSRPLPAAFREQARSSAGEKRGDLVVSYRMFGILRMTLAFFVVIWHSGGIATVNDGKWALVRYGSVAVFVFFVLSGFIITEASVKLYCGRPVAFFMNRLVRLYPPYLFALSIGLLVILVVPPVGSPLPAGVNKLENVLLNTIAILPIVSLIHASLERIDLISIIWAVRVEFAFYLVVTLILCTRGCSYSLVL